MDLQTVFYIVGLIFMGVSLALIIGIVTAILVIRAKIVSLEKMVEDKIHSATIGVNKAVELASAVGEVARAVNNRK